MNLVHLIGEIHSSPELHLLSNGRRQVKFTLTTQESYLDVQGAKKHAKIGIRYLHGGDGFRF
jgi:single-stranded DNA-binding protein